MPDMQLSPAIHDRASKIKLLLMDCDGVLTDGRLYFDKNGEALKIFNTRDGQGIGVWHRAGFRSGIISGRQSAMVDLRGAQLGMEFIWQGRNDKLSAFNEILSAADVSPEETAFIGDDTPDVAVMLSVGFSVAVGDAEDAVKDAAHYVTKRLGGRGAVREVIDLLLQANENTND